MSWFDFALWDTKTVVVYKPFYLAIALVVAAGAVIAGAPATASADLVTTNTLLGNDVSQPQCFGAVPAPLPTPPAFAIVGVNGGVANTSNSCFAAQVAWAQTARGGTKQHRIAYYVNTANPALKGSWWPTSNKTQASTEIARTPVSVKNPYGTCKHKAGSACAFVYGYSMARDDATIRGVASPGSQAWWLDVETANTWQKDKKANIAALEGMTAYFTKIGASVGVYATPSHWSEIVGTVPLTSKLAKLPSWIARGPVAEATAISGCGKASLTPAGRVSLVQFVAAGFDYNVSCLKFTTAPKPKISGSVRVGKKLTATVKSWHPSASTTTYRWYRDGKKIAKATHKTYVVKRADLGKRITVTVTKKLNGYSTLAKTSSYKRVTR